MPSTKVRDQQAGRRGEGEVGGEGQEMGLPILHQDLCAAVTNAIDARGCVACDVQFAAGAEGEAIRDGFRQAHDALRLARRSVWAYADA